MMNKIISTLFLILLCTSHNIAAEQRKSSQDFGGDKYGMKKYVVAFLKKGPNRDKLTNEQRSQLQAAHMKNISRMATEKQLVLAGPFLDDGELRGIYVFNTDSVEQAKRWTETDPAIKAGSLVMELKPWYGSAAIMAINDIHNEITANATK